jgi:hypothetical protein
MKKKTHDVYGKREKESHNVIGGEKKKETHAVYRL